MAESKMTPEEIMEAVQRLKPVENTVVVDYDGYVEKLKEENARLRSDNATLRLQNERLQSQLNQRVRHAADYVPYPDYEDR